MAVEPERVTACQDHWSKGSQRCATSGNFNPHENKWVCGEDQRFVDAAKKESNG